MKDRALKFKFTLVELIFVIAIIGILAGIMLPTLISSKARARKANCISNLKQIAIANKMYLDDYNVYPDAYHQAGGGQEIYWCALDNNGSIEPESGSMQSYIQNFNLLLCPEAESGDTIAYDQDYGLFCSYGINAEYVGGSPDSVENPTLEDILDSQSASIRRISAPSRTLLFMDSAEAEGDSVKEVFYFWARYSYVTGFEHDPLSQFRHLGHAAGAFCDGHVDDVKPDAIADKARRLGWPKRRLCDPD